MTNTHIENLVTALTNKINSLINSHNSNNSAHSSLFNTKQDTLISGSSIKTINNQSILGSGNISISGGSGNNSSDCLTNFSYDSTNDELVLEYCNGKLISSVSKSTSGDIDTYTINYTDNTNYQFTVTNGSSSSVTIADNLTTNDSLQALSAKQGKVLNDKIGDILTIINGSGD